MKDFGEYFAVLQIVLVQYVAICHFALVHVFIKFDWRHGFIKDFEVQNSR